VTAELRPYTKYKDSGLPWVGKVPVHWRVERGKWLFRRLQRPVRQEDDVVTCFRDGMVTLRKNRRTAGFTNSLQEIGYQGVRKGDLVIHAMDAFAGAIGVSDSEGKCTPVYAVCIPRQDLNSNYYAYVVREMARTQWILALAKGIRERSTEFRFDTFGSQYLPVPPRDEQDGISAFLHDRDRRIRRFIRNRRRLIEMLNEQKQALINRAVTRGLNPDVPLKQSGIDWLGYIPDHWEVHNLRWLFGRHGSGTTPNGEHYYGGDIPWVMTGDLTDAEIHTSKRTVTKQALADISVLRLYSPGSLLVAMYGATIGKTGVLMVDACTNQACCVLAEPITFVNVLYLQAVVRVARPHLIQKGYGGGQPNINAEIIRSLRVPLPPRD
jgi:type I restriction enzyme, S subunit